MGAYKKMEGRCVWIDFTEIHVPSWKIYEVTKAAQAKARLLKKIDPFARCMGRKRKYETPDQLKAVCDRYFKDQECFVYDKWGKPLIDPETGEYIKSTKPLTLSGLGRYTGLSTRLLRRYQSIAESGTVPYEFAIVVSEALQRIEEYAESRNYDRDGQRGAQFVLERGFKWQSPKELREMGKIRTELDIAKEKLRMQQEMHQAKMKLLEAGMGDEVDNDIKITITRAAREEE